MNPLQQLDQRIVAALNRKIRVADLECLILDVTAAVEHAELVANDTQSRALDPVLAGAQVRQARTEAQDAAFTRDRLKTARAKLEDRIVQVRARAAAENPKLQARYDEIEAERDRLAAELVALYPAFASRVSRKTKSLVHHLSNDNKRGG